MSVPVEYEEIVNKMSMGGMGSSSGAAAKSCKISMLWNWYTIDTCFIAKSWMNDTKGKFAGSCIGCFALVVVAQWLNRCGRQFDIELTERNRLKQLAKRVDLSSHDSGSSMDGSLLEEYQLVSSESSFKTTLMALGRTLSHHWYLNFVPTSKTRSTSLEEFLNGCDCGESAAVYPSLFDHAARCILFTVQWGLSYIIMLLFMYYNGYIIISCIIGALVGRFLFNYEPLASCSGGRIQELGHDKQVNDRKCCM